MRTNLRALLLAASALPAVALAAPARAADEATNTVESVIVTGVRNPEDPPVVQEARTRLSETPGVLACPAPALGEHTREVLRGAGLTDDQIQQLAASGVIRT